MLVPVTMDSSFQFFPHCQDDSHLPQPQRPEALSPDSLRALVSALRHLHQLDNTILPAPSSGLRGSDNPTLFLPPHPSGGRNSYHLGLLQVPLSPIWSFKIYSTNPLCYILTAKIICVLSVSPTYRQTSSPQV